MILYFANDLVWATRIKRTAEAVGIPCRPVRETRTLAERLVEGGVQGLIVDLETEQRGIEMVRAARAHESGATIQIVCFAPHVREDLLHQAAEAGADRAMARGAFDRRLVEILQQIEDGPSPADA